MAARGGLQQRSLANHIQSFHDGPKADLRRMRLQATEEVGARCAAIGLFLARADTDHTHLTMPQAKARRAAEAAASAAMAAAAMQPELSAEPTLTAV